MPITAPVPQIPQEPSLPSGQRPKSYYLQYCQGFYHDFQRNGPPIFFNRREEYEENRLYSLGMQDVNLYKRQVGVEENGPSYVQLDWTVLPIWPKFRDIIQARLNARRFRPTAKPIDAASTSKQREFRHKQLAELLHREDTQQLQAAGVPVGGEPALPDGVSAQLPLGEPQTEQEIDLFHQLNYKSHLALAAEAGARLVFWDNDLDEVRIQVQRDIIDCAVGVVRDWVERSTGLIRFRRCDPANCVSGMTTRGDFKYLTRFGELVPMSPGDILRAAGPDLNSYQQEQVRQLAKGGVRGTGGAGMGLLEGLRQRGFLLVLDCEWLGQDELVLPGNQTDQAYRPETYGMLYQCKWVVGTDICFDCGPARDQKRLPQSPRQAHLTFSVQATELDAQMRNLPYTSRVKPICDDLQLTRLKIQQLVAAAIPKGLLIQIESLQGVTAGDGEDDLKPLEVLGIYTQTGNILYSGLDVAGDPSRALPIKELENGLARDAIKLVEFYNFHLAQLRDVTGLNEITDASGPASGALVGTGQMAQQATNLALDPLVTTERLLWGKVTRAIVTRFQQRFRDYQGRGAGAYADALGEQALQMFQSTDALDLAELGVELSLTDTPEELDKFDMLTDMAVSSRLATGQGGLDIEDGLLIKRIARESSVKLAEQYLLFRQRFRKEEDMRQAQMQAQMNSQQQQESAQMQARLAQEQAALDAQTALAQAQAMSQLRMAEDNNKHRNTMELEELKLTGKAQIVDLQGDIDLEIIDEQIRLFDAKTDHRTRNLDDGPEDAPKVPEPA